MEIMIGFLSSYERVAQGNGYTYDQYASVVQELVLYTSDQMKNPYPFKAYHKAIRSPTNYQQFGRSMIRHLIDLENSTLTGTKNLEEITEAIERGENVILLANHQIEADPQVLGLLLEKEYPEISDDMIFVAGERVITDPVAIPFSMGCNLLCIYSKRYVDNPPEEKEEKLSHNKKTMTLMANLLSEGGKCIYVAPSGGRDRRNSQGLIEIAPFHPKSVEMFYLMSKRAKSPTHFYPLSLHTYPIMPPPETVQTELGEARTTEGGAVHLHFGAEIDMENFPGKGKNSRENRTIRADYIHSLVKSAYDKF